MYSGVFDARNTQVELVKQKYTKRVFDVAFDVFAQNRLSTLGGTSLLQSRASGLSAVAVPVLNTSVKCWQAFALCALSTAPRNAQPMPRFDADYSLALTGQPHAYQARLAALTFLFFNSRVACICERLDSGPPGCTLDYVRIEVNPHFY